MAPEIIVSGEYSPAGDVYAFGVVLLVMLTRQKLWPTLGPQAIMRQVGHEGLSPTIPDDLLDDNIRPKWIPRTLVDLMRRCLDRTPANRPTMKEICKTV